MRHLMLKKRSAPMSAPKPASVMRKSPPRIPILSATMEELPVAMLPKGPAWTSTGVFSSVCIRFGFIASFSITAMAPAAFRSSAVIGFAVHGAADHDPPQPLAQILEGGRRARGSP